jgi:glycosyltransferase domain-containing protein
MNLTIVVPTYNRPDLLLRLVSYYAQAGYQGKLLLADSSDKTVYEKTRAQTDLLAERLTIRHCYFPGRSVSEAMYDATMLLDTDYACLLPDDDFIVPRTAMKCMDFLANNPDFVAAHGLGALVASHDGEANRIDGATFYPQTISVDDLPSVRLDKHLKNYSVSLFSVFRLDAFRILFSSTVPEPGEGELRDKSFKDELLPCCLSVLLGKIGQVDGLYLIRQVHNQRYLLKTWFHWITGTDWSASYQYFRKRLARELTLQDTLSMEDAGTLVDECFSAYLAGSIALKTRVTQPRYTFLKTIGLYNRVRDWRNRIAVWRSPATISSYASLTASDSPFAADFQLIGQVITGTKTGGEVTD